MVQCYVASKFNQEHVRHEGSLYSPQSKAIFSYELWTISDESGADIVRSYPFSHVAHKWRLSLTDVFLPRSGSRFVPYRQKFSPVRHFHFPIYDQICCHLLPEDSEHFAANASEGLYFSSLAFHHCTAVY